MTFPENNLNIFRDNCEKILNNAQLAKGLKNKLQCELVLYFGQSLCTEAACCGIPREEVEPYFQRLLVIAKN